jgi:hypothetical protein
MTLCSALHITFKNGISLGFLYFFNHVVADNETKEDFGSEEVLRRLKLLRKLSKNGHKMPPYNLTTHGGL